MHPRFQALLAAFRPPALATAICGHRGSPAVAPENTLSSFRGAVEAGCELVELDVFLTRDEHLIVVHDETLDRTTDQKGRVADLSLAEVRACDAGAWFGETFAGERVPELAEALEAIAGRAAPMIEVKQRAEQAPALVERLAGALERTGVGARAVVIVWDEETAARVRERVPGVLTALVAFTRRGIRRAAAAGMDGVVPYFRTATRRFVAEASEAQLFIAPWTVNRAKDIEFFARLGCEAVITDVPQVARDVLERLELERAERFLKYVHAAE